MFSLDEGLIKDILADKVTQLFNAMTDEEFQKLISDAASMVLTDMISNAIKSNIANMHISAEQRTNELISDRLREFANRHQLV